MIDIAFGLNTHDIYTGDDNDLALVSDADQVAQHVKIRLWTYLEEWFLDINAGTPYFQSILGRIYRPQEAAAIIRRRILDTPGVDRVENFNFSLTNRNLSITSDIIVGLETTTISISETL